MSVSVRLLTLTPSKCRLALARGSSGGIPLWENNGELVYCRTGLEGDRPPAEPASGRVACQWRDSEDPLALHWGPRGVPPEGLACKGFGPTERQLVVWSDDELLETQKVTCFERLELDDDDRT